jgi:uncharacterized membrane-anchored protein
MQTKLVNGGRTMNRDEILKKAQAEKKDERELQVKDKSYLLVALLSLFAAIIATVRFFMGH